MREPIEVPAPLAAARFELVALAGTGLSDAWLLARASASTGAGLVLSAATPTATGASRASVRAPSRPLLRRATGATSLGPLSQPGTPLTVSTTGLWIDGSFSRGGELFPFTVYVDKSTGAVTGSCGHDADDATLCSTASALGSTLGLAGCRLPELRVERHRPLRAAHHHEPAGAAWGERHRPRHAPRSRRHHVPPHPRPWAPAARTPPSAIRREGGSSRRPSPAARHRSRSRR